MKRYPLMLILAVLITSALSVEWMRALVLDRQGDVWFGTNGGVGVLRRESTCARGLH